MIRSTYVSIYFREKLTFVELLAHLRRTYQPDHKRGINLLKFTGSHEALNK